MDRKFHVRKQMIGGRVVPVSYFRGKPVTIKRLGNGRIAIQHGNGFFDSVLNIGKKILPVAQELYKIPIVKEGVNSVANSALDYGKGKLGFGVNLAGISGRGMMLAGTNVGGSFVPGPPKRSRDAIMRDIRKQLSLTSM